VNVERAPTSLTLATRNVHKTREIQEILGPGFTVRDLSQRTDIPDVAETGKTFEENATLKAIAVSRRLPGLILADDSGIEVDSLAGAPGVLSARYSGTRDDRQNVAKLLVEVARADPNKQNRRANFRCVLAVACEGVLLRTFCGTLEGEIIDTPRGTSGFGYDPVFVPDGFDRTFAETPATVKNRISHRARAVTAAIPFLKTPHPLTQT
jgi:XTP/dITP diphosphohydrolase